MSKEKADKDKASADQKASEYQTELFASKEKGMSIREDFEKNISGFRKQIDERDEEIDEINNFLKKEEKRTKKTKEEFLELTTNMSEILFDNGEERDAEELLTQAKEMKQVNTEMSQ